MLAIAACIIGVFVLLVISEILRINNQIAAIDQRKFVHLTVGAFIASWPWIISWRDIQLIGAAMLAIVLLNRIKPLFHIHYEDPKAKNFGEELFAAAVILSAALTQVQVFFAMAFVTLALADGLAAFLGQKYGSPWRYKIFGQTKSVVGSIVFWLVSLCTLGFGVPFTANMIAYHSYVVLLLVLPPTLTALENLAVLGTDNLVIPLAVILAFRLIT